MGSAVPWIYPRILRTPFWLLLAWTNHQLTPAGELLEGHSGYGGDLWRRCYYWRHGRAVYFRSGPSTTPACGTSRRGGLTRRNAIGIPPARAARSHLDGGAARAHR